MIYRVTGFVRFYHVSKGYGFIRQDAVGRDVFILHRVVYAAGLNGLAKDAPITVDAIDVEKGPNAVEIIDYTPPIKPDRPERVHVGEISAWMRAKLKWYDPLLGYGFFELGDGANVLVHNEVPAREGIRITRFMANARKEFAIQYAHGPKGIYVTAIREVTE